MKIKNTYSLISELSLIMCLVPFILIIDRTIRVNGINISLILFSGIVCLVCFAGVWLLTNLKFRYFRYLNLLGLILSIIGLIIWLFWVELVSLYILGILVQFLASFPSVRMFSKDLTIREYPLSVHILQFLSLSLMCFSISFLISIFLWDNLIIFIIIGLNCLLSIVNIYLISHLKDDNTLRDQKSENKISYFIEHFLLLGILLLIPIGFTIVLFISVRGYLFYIPFNFNTLKLLSAIILASISVIFSFFYRRLSINKS